MQIPYLTELPAVRTMTDAFGGYDHRARIAEGSFYEMENMTGDAYPALSPRAKRGVRRLPAGAGAVSAMLSGPRLSYIAGNRLFVSDRPVMDLTEDGPKHMVGMGAYIVIFPDKVYFNTVDPADRGALEAFSETTGKVAFSLTDDFGDEVGQETPVGDMPPGNPENLQLWIDTAVSPPVLKRYSVTTGVWTAVLSTTVKISAKGIGSGFSPGDAVHIAGIPAGAAPFDEFNGTDIAVSAAGEDYLTFEGVMRAAFAETSGEVKISRALPVLDHVFECGNRLWGCRYGEDANGNFVNEIYASALGDFKNWRKYGGSSADSYTVGVGAAGPWTGGIAYQGMPHFFKDDVLYRVYGAYPAAFRVEQTACRGVQRGAERSLQILNERLYYKSRTGVCVYDGAYPALISEAFGEETFTGKLSDGQIAAAAGAWDNKYYISMLSEQDLKYHLFKFDAATAAWYREDNTEALLFAVEDGALRFLTPDGVIRSVRGEDEEKIRWSAETGTIFLESRVSGSAGVRYLRYLSRLTLHLQMEAGSRVSVQIQYDGAPPWIHVSTVTAASLKRFSLPVRPRRCDHFRLRISGEGPVKLFSMVKTMEEGSEF